MKDFLTQNFSQNLQLALNAMSTMEILAVILALAYLILAIRENIWCWVCGFSSTLIYLIIFWNVSLYSESLLQIFYLYMSIYGWLQWTKYKTNLEQLSLKPISTWTAKKHLQVLSLTAVIAIIIGALMANYSNASFPYIDAATTCFAIVATYMVAQKIFENWLYWMLIDSVSVYLYLSKDLYLTSLLYGFYVVLCFIGYFSWRKHLLQQQHNINTIKIEPQTDPGVYP